MISKFLEMKIKEFFLQGLKSKPIYFIKTDNVFMWNVSNNFVSFIHRVWITINHKGVLAKVAYKSLGNL